MLKALSLDKYMPASFLTSKLVSTFKAKPVAEPVSPAVAENDNQGLKLIKNTEKQKRARKRETDRHAVKPLRHIDKQRKRQKSERERQIDKAIERKTVR